MLYNLIMDVSFHGALPPQSGQIASIPVRRSRIAAVKDVALQQETRTSKNLALSKTTNLTPKIRCSIKKEAVIQQLKETKQKIEKDASRDLKVFALLLVATLTFLVVGAATGGLGFSLIGIGLGIGLYIKTASSVGSSSAESRINRTEQWEKAVDSKEYKQFLDYLQNRWQTNWKIDRADLPDNEKHLSDQEIISKRLLDLHKGEERIEGEKDLFDLYTLFKCRLAIKRKIESGTALDDPKNMKELARAQEALDDPTLSIQNLYRKQQDIEEKLCRNMGLIP